MRIAHRRAPEVAALLAAAAVAWALPTLAQDRTTITKLSGTVSGTGAWGRTIIDGQPGKTTTMYTVNVPYTPGLSADTIAARFQSAAQTTLPPAPNSAIGFGVVKENSVFPSIRVGRQTGTYTYFEATPTPPGITVTTFPPSIAADAPVVSPTGLAMLMASLTALAWWTRRRRRIA
jgi:hypothetical protein